MKKPALLLNLLWAAVAAGTFYAGVVWRGGDPKASASSTVGARFPAAPEPVKLAGSGQGAMIKADTVSRDDDVLDFLKRYGLDSGQPLTAESMGLAVSEALRETNPIKSQMLFARLMEEITPENAAAALAMLRENSSGFESMRYMSMLAYAWGGSDPKAAMEALQTGDGREGRMGVSTVLTGWAANDPQGAMAWLEKYEGEGKEWLSQSLISGLAKSDFDGAMKYATALQDEGERRRASETLARELIRTGGVEGAKSWLASLTDPDMKSGAFATLADQLRRSDREKAGDFIRENAAQPYAREAVAGLAEEMSRKDVQQALTFANSLNGPNQARAYAEVIGEWLDRNEGAESVQASQYVTQMPPGESRDAASATIARRMAGEDPAAAIAWATAIADPEQRENTLVDVGRRYMRSDPANAAAWLAQSGLSAEAQQQVTAPREERGWRGDFGGGGRGGGGGGRGGEGGGRRGR
ncbi:MAG: hypothetical protein ACKV19_25320 [Verrucomicrobiales bacterium]